MASTEPVKWWFEPVVVGSQPLFWPPVDREDHKSKVTLFSTSFSGIDKDKFSTFSFLKILGISFVKNFNHSFETNDIKCFKEKYGTSLLNPETFKQQAMSNRWRGP